MKMEPLAAPVALALLASACASSTPSSTAYTPAMASSGAQAPSVVIKSDATGNVLRAGTQIPVRFVEGLTTEGKNLRVGHRFRVETSEDVLLGSNLIIPAGTPGMGEVTEVRNKGMWGKSGRINARMLYLQHQGRQVRLSGSIDDKGVTGTAGVVGAIAVLPVAGFFVTGTSARIPSGTIAPAFLDEDLEFTAASTVTPVPSQAVSVPSTSE